MGSAIAPPSKSYTHRALVAGFLTGIRYRVESPLVSDDTLATARGIRALGAAVTIRPGVWTVAPTARSTPRVRRSIDCRRSGSTLRLLLPLAARLATPTVFRRRRELVRRPLVPLVRVLRRGGAVFTDESDGTGTFRVRGPLQPVNTTLDPSASSQFLSGLLFSLPTLSGPSRLRLVRPPVSGPYVEATRAVMSEHGVNVRIHGRRVCIPAPQTYEGRRFRVPGDASSASYLWAAGALRGSDVRVRGVDRRWPQADLMLLPLLRQMGAHVSVRGDEVRVAGPVRRPVRADLSDAPDLLPLVAVLAATVPARSVIVGAPHAARKESDRRAETARLLAAVGARVRLGPRRIEVVGRPPLRPFRYDGARDHRMVMSAAVAGMAASGPSMVGSAESVAKSFPEFWSVLEAWGSVSGGPR